jgi:hypothetical protein
VHLGVVTEPGETDFNYRPYLNFGGEVVNEAFLGDMTHVNPDLIKQKLIDAGVPQDRINILLAPGQAPGSRTGSNFSAYTWDDMKPEEQRAFLSAYRQGGGYRPPGGPGYQTPTIPTSSWQRYGRPTPTRPLSQGPAPNQLPPSATNPQLKTVGQAPPISRTGPIGAPPRTVGKLPPRPENAGFVQVTDAMNPQAQAYGRARLAQHGIQVRKNEDAARMWRDYSAKLVAARNVAASAGPQPANDVIALPPKVTAPPPPVPTPNQLPTPVPQGTLGTRFTRY